MEKQYITTDQHPCWKSGIVLTENYEGSLVDDCGFCIIYKMAIPGAVNQRYIKEIKPKKYTEDDMIDFLIYYDLKKQKNLKPTDILEWYDSRKQENLKHTFEDWKQSKK